MESCLQKKIDSQKVKILITDDYATSRDVGLCLYKALNKNIQLYFLSDRHLSLIRLSRFAKDVFVIPDSKDIDLYCNRLIEIIDNSNIDILFPVSSKSIGRVLRIQKELSRHCLIVALPELECFNIANNKWRLYNFLISHKIATPVTYCLNSDFDFCGLAYPVLLKPFEGSGGKGIVKLDGPPENKRDLISKYNREYIVQQYVEGYDIDCSVLCNNGIVLAYTIQRPMDKSVKFAPKGDKLSFVYKQDVFDIVQRTMSKLKWNGVAHIDLRFDSKNQHFCILEINPRFWTSILASLSMGVNFPYLLYKLAYNIKPSPHGKVLGHYFTFNAYLREFFKSTEYRNIGISNFRYHLMDPLFTLAKIVKRISNLHLIKHRSK